jgi:hypothetical protein
MLVKALKDGFYKGRRRAGAVFNVPDGAKAKWYEAVPGVDDSKSAPKVPTRQKIVAAKTDDLA